MPLSSGELLEHRYEIVAILKQDESGTSYLGHDLHIVGRTVVIKESLDLSPEAQREFMEQLMILAGLDHPNLVKVSDGFVGPNRGKYMIMDYVKGETLEDIVGRRGPLPEGEVIAIAQQLLRALGYLHYHSVVPGNVAPANIVIKPDGKAVLVDYGTSSRKRVVTEELFVTPGFAAIDQYTGLIDARSDLYSLGAVMYYLLTGLVPPAAPNLVVGDSILIPPRELQPELSVTVERVILRAMETYPKDRYPSAEEMLRTLDTAATKPAAYSTVLASERQRSPIRFLIAGVIAGTIIALSLVATGIGFLPGAVQPSRESPTPPVLFLPDLTSTSTESVVTPDITPAKLAALNIKAELQGDGTVKTTVQLSIDPLGVGDLQLIAPARIKLGESGIVRLSIIPDPAFTNLPRVEPALLSIYAPDLAANPEYVLEFSEQIQIYPLMQAKLVGEHFTIVSDDQPLKPVVSSSPVEWTWLVTPKAGGKQTLILYISIPVLIDEKKEELSSKPLRNIPIEVLVEVTPTPEPSPTPTLTPTPTSTPTPTPLPIARRIGNQLINNSSPILVAVFGLLGTILTVYGASQNSKRQAKIEALKAQIQLGGNKKEKEKLREQLMHLESIQWWQFWRR
jgi:serine/threonine protein kinase